MKLQSPSDAVGRFFSPTSTARAVNVSAGTGINWKVAALGAGTIALSAALYPIGIVALLVNLLAVGVLSVAHRWPLPMGAVLVGLFVVASAFEGLRTPVIVFSAPFFVAVVALVGRPRAAGVFGALLAYIGTTSPFTDKWIPYDFTGTFIYAGAIAAGLWAGMYFRRQRLQHAENQRRLRDEMEDRRDQLTRALHDSVATTLTSVVMRAETLGLTSQDNPRTREASSLIADETRQAMQEVRHLIHLMRDGFSEQDPPLHRTISDQFSVTARLLRSHGFDVRGDSSAYTRDESFPEGFERVFAELATNAIKYAAPNSAVELRLSSTARGVRCRMTNVIGSKLPPSHMTSGLGLEDVRQLVAARGGTFATAKRDGVWTATIDVPRKSLRPSLSQIQPPAQPSADSPREGGDFSTHSGS